MTRLALYREFRPQSFSEVVGQQHITRTLRNALAQKRLHHAYLLSGPRGTGKTTVARILAKAANCQDLQQGEPCNQCPACWSIVKGETMDVIEIDAASNRGIDEIRDLREKVKYVPGDLKFKVYIIDEVHMLSEAAFNALLKTLEEPPSHVLFVLATTEKHKLPITIISRCQCFDYHRLSTREIIERLEEVCRVYHIDATLDALTAIARQAEGGMRDALSLLDQVMAYSLDEKITIDDTLQVLGSAPLDRFLELDRYLIQGEIGRALLLLDELIRQGKDLRQFVRDFLSHLRDLLVLKIDKDASSLDLPAHSLDAMRLQANAVQQTQLLASIKLFAQVESEIRLSASPRLLIEVGLIRIVDVYKGVLVTPTIEPVGPVGQGDPLSRSVPQKGAEPSQPLIHSAERTDPVPPGKVDSQRAPSGAPTPFGEGVDRVLEVWESLLDIVKKTRPSTHMLLTQVRVGGVRGNVIILIAQNAAFVDLLNRPADKSIIEKTLAKIGLTGMEIQPVGLEHPMTKAGSGVLHEQILNVEQTKGSLMATAVRIFSKELVHEMKEGDSI